MTHCVTRSNKTRKGDGVNSVVDRTPKSINYWFKKKSKQTTARWGSNPLKLYSCIHTSINICFYIYNKTIPPAMRSYSPPPPPDNLRRGDANFPFLRRICVASASATQTFHFFDKFASFLRRRRKLRRRDAIRRKNDAPMLLVRSVGSTFGGVAGGRKAGRQVGREVGRGLCFVVWRGVAWRQLEGW